MQRISVILTALVASVALLAGCATNYIPGNYKQVNELSISMEGITNLEIQFDARNITLLSTSGDTLEIRDFMDRDNADAYSAAVVADGTITISETRQNTSKGMGGTPRAEIAIPKAFAGALDISLVSGELTAQTDLSGYESISLGLQNGYMHMQEIKALDISLDAVNGTIKTENAQGRGRFSVQTGTIAAFMDEFTDDLTLNEENGTLYLTLAHDTSFQLDATAGRGMVRRRAP